MIATATIVYLLIWLIAIHHSYALGLPMDGDIEEGSHETAPAAVITTPQMATPLLTPTNLKQLNEPITIDTAAVTSATTPLLRPPPVPGTAVATSYGAASHSSGPNTATQSLTQQLPGPPPRLVKVHPPPPQNQPIYPTNIGASTGRRFVHLTFDDGPNGAYGQELLNSLKEENVTASFFYVGYNLQLSEKYVNKSVASGRWSEPGGGTPDHIATMKRAMEEGHFIGQHTYSHKAIDTTSSVSQLENEIDRTEELIHQLTGARPHLFRAPFGSNTMDLQAYLRSHKYLYVPWSADISDWRMKSSQEVVNQINRMFPDTGEVTKLLKLEAELDRKTKSLIPNASMTDSTNDIGQVLTALTPIQKLKAAASAAPTTTTTENNNPVQLSEGGRELNSIVRGGGNVASGDTNDPIHLIAKVQQTQAVSRLPPPPPEHTIESSNFKITTDFNAVHVVLMHEGDGTCRSMREVIRAIKRNGYEFVGFEYILSLPQRTWLYTEMGCNKPDMNSELSLNRIQCDRLADHDFGRNLPSQLQVPFYSHTPVISPPLRGQESKSELSTSVSSSLHPYPSTKSTPIPPTTRTMLEDVQIGANEPISSKLTPPTQPTTMTPTTASIPPHLSQDSPEQPSLVAPLATALHQPPSSHASLNLGSSTIHFTFSSINGRRDSKENSAHGDMGIFYEWIWVSAVIMVILGVIFISLILHLLYSSFTPRTSITPKNQSRPTALTTCHPNQIELELGSSISIDHPSTLHIANGRVSSWSWLLTRVRGASVTPWNAMAMVTRQFKKSH